MNSLIKKLAFVITLTTLSGCAALQNTPSSVKEPQVPKKTASQEPEYNFSSEEIVKPLPPLLSGGKKPLLIEKLAQKVDFPPVPKDDVQPCVDAKTGKPVSFLLADLKSELIPLSYSGMDSVLSSLQVMGLKTVEATGPIANPYTVNKRGQATMLPKPKLTHDRIGYTCSELPVFYKPKTDPVKTLSQVLQGPASRAVISGNIGSRLVNMSSTDYGSHESLIAFYHADNRKRFDTIKKTIQKTLDAAPVQIYIESMVLEVNESGLEELGVLYKANVPGGVNQTLELGATSATTPSNAALSSATPFFKAALEKGIGATSVTQLLSISLEALIAKGSAEVLSRPSIITINNRPAVIEVTEQKQFPIRTASTGYNGVVSLSYDFKEVNPGILLQIRPRVSDSNNEVAMEIDVQVKALVSANDATAFTEDGTKEIGTKPGTSTRRVHTFAMVPNKTPIIIGGLVSKERNDTTNKIPFLADIPFIGRLFGAELSTNSKKEVIVVITPHIIRNNNEIGIQTPKDTDMFDDENMDLFRDSYRVRAEDVFDLGFVYQSKQFNKYRNYVVRRSERDAEFAETALAKSYSGANFPGGDALVTRMIYDIVGKRNYADQVSADKIIMTEHSGDGKFEKVIFLQKEWQKAQAKSKPAKEGGKRGPGYGLELTFSGTETPNSSVQPHVALRTLPLGEIALHTDTSAQHKDSSRIFIASEKDLKKIRRALVVREVQKLNRSKHIFGHLNEFGPGTKFILPVIKKTRYFLLDSDVATIYHQSKFYYQILEESLKESFLLVENQIKKDNKANERIEELRKAAELRKAEQLKRAQQLKKAEQLKRAQQLKKAKQLRRAQQPQRRTNPGTKTPKATVPKAAVPKATVPKTP